jgi:hypothetical protein
MPATIRPLRPHAQHALVPPLAALMRLVLKEANRERREHQQFGDDGFEDAIRRIERVEQTLGLAELGGQPLVARRLYVRAASST